MGLTVKDWLSVTEFPVGDYNIKVKVAWKREENQIFKGTLEELKNNPSYNVWMNRNLQKWEHFCREGHDDELYYYVSIIIN